MSLVDNLEGTLVWEGIPIACPHIIVQLFKGLIKFYTIQANMFKGRSRLNYR
jgi:hypothetical protein